MYCPRAEEWIKLAFKNLKRPFDYDQECEIFRSLESMVDEDFKQSKEYAKIKQDVNRTVYGSEYFSENS